MDKLTCTTCDGQFQPDMMATKTRCRGCQRQRLHSDRVAKVYGITGEQYAAILKAQGGVCYICHRKPQAKRLACDHDHRCCPGPVSCGRCVRGLLCRNCNRDVLGHLKDDPAALLRAVEYLADPPAKKVLAWDAPVAPGG
jgi:hypothetical protein